MFKPRGFFIVFIVLAFFVTRVFAQTADCPDLVQSALDSTETFCDATSRNEICYGNINLAAEAQQGVPDIVFETPGDIEGLNAIQSIQLEGMNVDAGLWGVALLRIQANLPDTDPGRNVTMLLFGDVQMTNAVPPQVQLNATVASDAAVNLRVTPSTDSPVLVALEPGTAVTVTGRSADGQWLRVRLDGDTGGWIFTSLLTIDGDASTLETVDPNSYTPSYGPMQAFIFESGVDDGPCDEAPDSGIFIQTPEGEGEINLLVNEVDIRLGSELYMNAGPNEDGENVLTFGLINGTARIESNGVAQYLQPGQSLNVPLSEDFTANGQPSDPQPYDGNEDGLGSIVESETIEGDLVIPPPFEPDPSDPVITRIEVARNNDTTTYEDIYFTDLEGDVVTLNIALVELSDNRISYRFEGTGIDISPEAQQEGALIQRQTICTEGTTGVEALFRITVTDAAGNESNIVEYRTTCGG